jgi:hypothetical protein
MRDQNGYGVLAFDKICGDALIATDILSVDIDSNLIQTVQMKHAVTSARNIHKRPVPGKRGLEKTREAKAVDDVVKFLFKPPV